MKFIMGMLVTFGLLVLTGIVLPSLISSSTIPLIFIIFMLFFICVSLVFILSIIVKFYLRGSICQGEEK